MACPLLDSHCIILLEFGLHVPTSPPPLSERGEAGRNHLNEAITLLLPTGLGERAIQPNHIKI
jgi:hypothetical protein